MGSFHFGEQHMVTKFRSFVHSVIFSFIVFLIMFTFSELNLNIDFLDPFEKTIQDLDFSDISYSFYDVVSKKKPDTNIVLINIKKISRDQIADVIDSIHSYSPKVIGIDILFSKRKNISENVKIQNALSNKENIVLIDIVESHKRKFDSIRRNELSKNPKTLHGFANLNEEANFRTIRTFNPFIETGKDTLFAFSVLVANYLNPNSKERVVERDNQKEIINFKGNYEKFYYLDAEEIYKGKVKLNFIHDKIILMGYVGSGATLKNDSFDEDKFFTPLNPNFVGRGYPDMYGVVIHANIISMLVNSNYINYFHDFVFHLLLYLFIFLNTFIFAYLYNRTYKLYSSVSKLIILAESLLVFIVSILLFIFAQFKVDIKLFLIGLILLPDFYEAYQTIQRKIKSKLGRIK